MEDPDVTDGAPAGVRALEERVAADLEARIGAAARELAGEGAASPLLVGCSGGPDSTCLLVALAAVAPERPLVAVYVDHGLRRGTAAEAERVRELCAALSTAARTIRFASVAVRVERRGNVLAAARRARYAALAACAREHGATQILVGHTASDQAETVAFRQLRGDPDEALSGMPAARDLDLERDGCEGALLRLSRPLLLAGVTRAEVLRYLAARDVHDVVEDPSNLDHRFTRVRLRAELAARGPADEAALLRLADTHAALLANDDSAALALGPLEDLDAARVAAAGLGVLLRLLRRAGLHRAGLRHARALALLAGGHDGSASIDLGRAGSSRSRTEGNSGASALLVAERRYHRLRIGPAAPRIEDAQLMIFRDEVMAAPLPVRLTLLGKTLELQALAADEAGRVRAADPGSLLDPSAVPPALVLRNLRAGDHFRGARGGRKLSDVLIDRKVPRPLRRGLLLLAPVDGRELLWVEGVGAAAVHPGSGSAGEVPGPRLRVRLLPTESVGAPPGRGG